jgi:hypothetical protein
MREARQFLFFIILFTFFSNACKKQNTTTQPVPPVKKDTPFVNLAHLNDLYTPVTFPDGSQSGGIFIYSAYPDYHPVEATGEGFTCVDDVARALLVYIRSDQYATDTAIQSKSFHLIQFLLSMQAGDGYFYNFLQTDETINTTDVTSMATANWWSWRALQALAVAVDVVKNTNPQLAVNMDIAIHKVVGNIKSDLVNLPRTTEIVSGITVPQWLPAGSSTDQAATLILGLIPYCKDHPDTVIQNYLRKLADGILMMQEGDAATFPYSLFLSAQNQWHAYGSDQSFALLNLAEFLNDTLYLAKALDEINHFYPWLIAGSFKSSISITYNNSQFQPILENDYEQIAYGFRPMVFATIEAYSITGLPQYADMAGHLAAWFLGSNVASANMYDSTTGRCYDAISASNQVNLNSGAESTIEALLTMQRVQKYPSVKTALDLYKKH